MEGALADARVEEHKGIHEVVVGVGHLVQGCAHLRRRGIDDGPAGYNLELHGFECSRDCFRILVVRGGVRAHAKGRRDGREQARASLPACTKASSWSRWGTWSFQSRQPALVSGWWRHCNDLAWGPAPLSGTCQGALGPYLTPFLQG